MCDNYGVDPRRIETPARAHDDADTRWTAAEHSPLGRRLRTTHLDELPQLINVMRGEMSLVGPRPERPYFSERFSREVPRYADRTRMPAGMTGWAQVNGLNGDTSIFERARFDNYYAEYWSIWLDLVILARTVATVLRGIWTAGEVETVEGGFNAANGGGAAYACDL